MNRLFYLAGCFLLSCTSCTETGVMRPSVAPIVEVEPEKPAVEEPKPKPVIDWMDPEDVQSLMETNCFVLKFYSTEVLENKLLDVLLSDEQVVLKINSAYIPVTYNDNVSDRGLIGFGIDDDFAGLMIVPSEDEIPAALIEIDQSTGYELPDEAAGMLLQVLNDMNCDRLIPSNIRYHQGR